MQEYFRGISWRKLETVRQWSTWNSVHYAYRFIVYCIPIFMIDLNWKSTIKKNRIDQKIGKRR